jgi:hypothetical protein
MAYKQQGLELGGLEGGGAVDVLVPARFLGGLRFESQTKRDIFMGKKLLKVQMSFPIPLT